ncbi:MAG: response regulator [Deltaproteobacteria bacterium]|nr:response regulator [Deltaproteobacteria bacterium]
MPRALDVLIVDDDPLITRALARVLRGRHTVRLAEDLGQALALLEERTPDVVLCDFCMGDLTAAGFLRTVRARWPQVRLVLHSASRAELWHELLADGPIDGAVVKPAAIDDLMASLEA